MAKNKKNCKHPIYARNRNADGSYYCIDCKATGLEAPPAPVMVEPGIYFLKEDIDNSAEKDGRSTDWTRHPVIEAGVYYVYTHGDRGMRIEKDGERTYERMTHGHSNQALMLSKLEKIEGTDNQYLNYIDRANDVSPRSIVLHLMNEGKLTRQQIAAIQ